MPTSFDVALTQLSFMELVQRCNVLATTSQPTQLSVSISQTLLCRPPHHVEFLMTLPPRRRTSLVPRYPLTLLPRRLPAVQVPHSWMLPCRRHHTVLCPGTFLRSLALAQCPRFQLMRHCRLLPIVLCYLTQPHNLTSRSSSLAGFSLTVHWIIVIPFASHRQQYRAHAWYPCRRLDLFNQLLPPRLRLRRSRSPIPAVLNVILCSPLLVPPMWEHTQFALLVPSVVLVPPMRETTTLLALALVLRLPPSPNPMLWSSLCSTLGTPKLAAPVQSPQRTAISCITNFAFPYYSGIQARHAEILPILSPPPVAHSMQLFSRKPATMSRTSLIISLRTLTTRTLQFYSTRTPLSQTKSLPRISSTLRARILGAWCCSLSVLCFVVPLFLVHLQSHFARYISTMLWPRNVTPPPSFSNSSTPKCWSTMLISSVEFQHSAFSTVSDVFSDPEFSAPGIRVCGTRCVR